MMLLILIPKITKMKKIKSTIGLLILFLALSVQAEIDGKAFEIQIDVAPNVLNLYNQGEVVTIHTDIAFTLVSGSTVTLNGVEIHHWKADDRGNFVAKFLMSEVKALDLNSGELNTLTLIGTSSIGDFWGSQEIKVIEVIPVAIDKTN